MHYSASNCLVIDRIDSNWFLISSCFIYNIAFNTYYIHTASFSILDYKSYVLKTIYMLMFGAHSSLWYSRNDQRTRALLLRRSCSALIHYDIYIYLALIRYDIHIPRSFTTLFIISAHSLWYSYSALIRYDNSYSSLIYIQRSCFYDFRVQRKFILRFSSSTRVCYMILSAD